jgi:Ala-tRNA(Pro) deacylase
MDAAELMKVFGNRRRLGILSWLADPRANFPAQRDGDLVTDGVCLVVIAQKAGISQPAASKHMELLVAAGVVVATPIGRWTFYRRDEAAIATAAQRLTDSLTKGLPDVEGRPSVALGPHQGYTIPRATTHRTRAPARTVVLMSSAAGVVPTGDDAVVMTGDPAADRPAGAERRLLELLDGHGATFRSIDHAPEGRTEIVSALRGNPLPAAAKCMIAMVKLDKKRRRHVLAVVPGDRRVDLDAVKRLHGGRYAAMADTETAERLSGCETGTILPFTWSDELDLVVDPALYDHDTIYFNAARLDRSIALASADHRRIATPTEAAIATPAAVT